MPQSLAPEQLRIYRARVPLKNGTKMLRPGDIVDGTRAWDSTALQACISQGLIEAVPFPEEKTAPPAASPPKADPWRGQKPVPAPAPAVKAKASDGKKRPGRPPGAKNKPKAEAASEGTPLPATGLPGELKTEEERQAERLRVAKIGLRAQEVEREKGGVIDITNDP